MRHFRDLKIHLALLHPEREVEVNRGAQSAGDRVQARKQHSHHGADPERRVRAAECVRQQGAENDRAGIDGDGNFVST